MYYSGVYQSRQCYIRKYMGSLKEENFSPCSVWEVEIEKAESRGDQVYSKGSLEGGSSEGGIKTPGGTE
jgi:hypothetical protein